MTKVRGDYLTRFKPKGDGFVSSPVCTVLPEEVDLYVRSLPNRSEWLRRVICEAVEAVKLPEDQDNG